MTMSILLVYIVYSARFPVLLLRSWVPFLTFSTGIQFSHILSVD